ncbi:hypothetical protein ACWYXK_19970 [Janthinobacterium lividum]
MAQLNIRVSDADKLAAEAVASSAGFDLGEYLRTIITYISTHKKLPVVIKFKPVAIKPEEVFQQAIIKFHNAYLQILQFRQDVLVEEEMTPLQVLHQLSNDVNAAETFYRLNESQIALAEGQLEKIVISTNQAQMFPRCREHFPHIATYLQTAIRMVNMNNRPPNSQDFKEMDIALLDASKHINSLQEMSKCEISAEARCLFFVEDVRYAVLHAKEATKKGAAYSIFNTWQEQMENYIRQADSEFKSLGVVKNLHTLKLLWQKMHTMGEAVNSYLEHTSMHGLKSTEIDDVEELLSEVHQPSPLPN